MSFSSKHIDAGIYAQQDPAEKISFSEILDNGYQNSVNNKRAQLFRRLGKRKQSNKYVAMQAESDLVKAASVYPMGHEGYMLDYYGNSLELQPYSLPDDLIEIKREDQQEASMRFRRKIEKQAKKEVSKRVNQQLSSNKKGDKILLHSDELRRHIAEFLN